MEQAISELEQIISQYAPQLAQLSEDAFALKPLPDKWSKKETLGHLIDSVQNNIRRFIVAQYEENPHIVYAQDFWVTAAGYQHYYTTDLVALWVLLNKHACRVLQNIPEAAGKKQCLTGELHSIEWLAADYNKHLLHHLHQILNLEPVAYP
jgi:DinB superfamily